MSSIRERIAHLDNTISELENYSETLQFDSYEWHNVENAIVTVQELMGHLLPFRSAK